MIEMQGPQDFFKKFILCAAFSILLASCASTTIGPQAGGRISGIAASPYDENALLVSSPGGGLWQTLDNGQHWRNISANIDDPNVYHIEWDAIDPNRLFVVSASGVFTSTNALSASPTFQKISGVVAGDLIWPDRPPYEDSFVFEQTVIPSPAPSRIILFGLLDRLYFSDDAQTFNNVQIQLNPSDPDANRLLAVAVDQATQQVYISTLNTVLSATPKVYRSQANPWSSNPPAFVWEDVSAGLNTQRAQIISLEWTGQAGRLAAGAWNPNGSDSTIWQKPGQAANWGVPNWALPTVGWGPRKLYYAGADQLFYNNSPYAFQTLDMGQNWELLNVSSSATYQPPGAAQPLALTQHADTRAITTRAYSGPTRGYLWSGTDGYREIDNTYVANLLRWDWSTGTRPANPQAVPVDGLGIWQVRTLVHIERSPTDRLIAGSHDNSAWCSGSFGGSGRYWEWMNPEGIPAGDVISLAAAPSDSNRVYSLTNNELSRTDNAQSAPTCPDVNWTVLATPTAGTVQTPKYWTRHAIAVHPLNRDKVYVASGNAIRVSQDGATTWNQFTNGTMVESKSRLPGNAFTGSLFVHPVSHCLYAGTENQGIFSSCDEGQSWQTYGLNTSSPPKYVLAMAWSTSGGPDGTFFAATTSGLYRKVSGTWSQLSLPESRVPSDVVVDDANGDVYVAFGFTAGLGQQPGGLWVSGDNGATWTVVVDDGAPVTTVLLTRDGSNLDVYLGTYGNGISSYRQ